MINKMIEKNDGIKEIKKQKENKLLDTAFSLFTQKGVNDTSIQDIVDQAGVAKGTFYLYFKDKYDIRDQLIKRTSEKLFRDALISLEKSYIENFEDQIIFVINYVIDELNKNKIILQFIAKDLSWGVFNQRIRDISSVESENKNLYLAFIGLLDSHHIILSNPKITLFTIIELVSSTCFTSILYKEPIPIEEYKPYLYSLIRDILKK